ncbi:MAG: hypothetical protein JO075_11655, partial [Acidimicrobiia bacterium]|nr:hypothetical protein [Acidimicrobiia bacterium]
DDADCGAAWSVLLSFRMSNDAGDHAASWGLVGVCGAVWAAALGCPPAAVATPAAWGTNTLATSVATDANALLRAIPTFTPRFLPLPVAAVQRRRAP